MRTASFARAAAMLAGVRAALALSSEHERRAALAALGTYRSRGHGRGAPLGRGYVLKPIPAALREAGGPTERAVWVSRSKYTPHQGAQERARRLVGGWTAFCLHDEDGWPVRVSKEAALNASGLDRRGNAARIAELYA